LIPLFFVKENRTRVIKKGIIRGIKELNPKLKYFVLVASVFALANFGLYLFLLLRVKEITGSIVTSLIVYAIFNFVYVLFVVPFGILSDKIGRKRVLLIGYVLFFLISLSFIFVNNLFYFAALFVLYGLVYAITQANQRALVSDLSGKMKGTSFGFYSSVIGIVNIFGGLIAGILWDISYTTMFVYISVIALLSVFLLIFLKRR